MTREPAIQSLEVMIDYVRHDRGVQHEHSS